MSAGLDLISSIIQNNEVSNFLELREDFFIDNEIQVYTAVSGHLRQYNVLPSLTTLESIGFNLPTITEPTEYYLNTVANRKCISVMGDNYNQYINTVMDGRNIDGGIDILRGIIREVEDVRSGGNSIDMPALRRDTLDKYYDTKRGLSDPGINFGWPYLDRETDGMFPGDLISLVGRPSVGKTMLLLKCACNAFNQGKKVLFVSMEMESAPVDRRMMGIMLGMNPNLIKKGQLSIFSEQRMEAYADYMDQEDRFNLITGRFRQSVNDIEACATRIQPDVVYVDASYLLFPSNAKSKARDKRESLSDVIEGLKLLAMNHEVPVCITVQFNRNVGKPKKDESVLDLMELDKIYESDVYGQMSSICVGIAKENIPNGENERVLKIMKSREGGSGHFRINYITTPMIFSEITEEEDVNDLF